MEKSTRVKWILRGVLVLFALLAAYLIARYRGFSAQAAAFMNFRYWSDGFFVAGLMLTGIGALTLISTTDFFDIFSYAFHSLLVLFTPLKSAKEHISFQDYKAVKDEKRGKKKFFLLLVGLSLIALSALCLLFYYRLGG